MRYLVEVVRIEFVTHTVDTNSPERAAEVAQEATGLMPMHVQTADTGETLWKHGGLLILPREHRLAVHRGEPMITVRRQTNSSAQLDFRWAGGAYIDIFWVGGEVPDNVDAHRENGRDGEDHEGAPFMNINVWDYAANQALIPFTVDALTEKADEWIDENREDYGL